MIVFDYINGQFYSDSQASYSMSLSNQFQKSAGKAIEGLGTGIGRKLAGVDRRRTLWGRISGRNKALDRLEQREHEERMARIQAGTDLRGLLKDRLDKYDSNSGRRQDRKDKKLEYAHQEKMARINNSKL